VFVDTETRISNFCFLSVAYLIRCLLLFDRQDWIGQNTSYSGHHAVDHRRVLCFRYLPYVMLQVPRRRWGVCSILC